MNNNSMNSRKHGPSVARRRRSSIGLGTAGMALASFGLTNRAHAAVCHASRGIASIRQKSRLLPVENRPGPRVYPQTILRKLEDPILHNTIPR